MSYDLRWPVGAAAAIAIALTIYHWCENRAERRAAEALERDRQQRTARYEASRMANRMNNERRHLGPVVIPPTQKAIPADQLQLWLTMALEVEAFRQELAELPEVDHP